MELSTLFSYDAIGLVGVVMYIAAYGALQLGLVQGSGYTYTLMNLAAALFVLISLMESFNLSSAIIQITWIVISIFGLARMFFLHYSTRLNTEETAFMKSKMPTLPKPLARRFLNAGLWVDAEPETEVATEGQPIGALIYLVSGAADVDIDGGTVGQLKPDTFIGELTCFDREPATASVKLTKKARFFRVSTDALTDICKRNPDLRFALENAIGRDTRMKLVAANARMSEAAGAETL